MDKTPQKEKTLLIQIYEKDLITIKNLIRPKWREPVKSVLRRYIDKTNKRVKNDKRSVTHE